MSQDAETPNYRIATLVIDVAGALMTTGIRKQSVSYFCLPFLNGLELMRATYTGQYFSRHMHDKFAIGVIEDGVGAFIYRGETHVATRGDIFVIHPGEAHTGGGLKDCSCTYRVLYPDEMLLRSVRSNSTGASRTPVFANAIIRDNETAALIRRLHITLENSATRLEQESLLVYALGRLIGRHACEKTFDLGTPREPLAIKYVRSYLEDHYSENISLSELTRLTGLSGFHLTNAFSQEVGLPPHAYLLQIRVLRAKELIAQGRSIVDAALATGFSHQSHLNRHFKRMLGLTPGQYRNGRKIVQDATPLKA